MLVKGFKRTKMKIPIPKSIQKKRATREEKKPTQSVKNKVGNTMRTSRVYLTKESSCTTRPFIALPA